MPSLKGLLTKADHRRWAWRLTATAILLAATLQTPVQADWLVLTSGDKIETRGTWELKGDAILFTSRRGQFSSVQAGEVDVEASRKLTEEAQRAAAADGDERTAVEPVLVLVDGDLPLYRPPAAMQDAAAGSPDEEAARAAPSSDPTETRSAQQTLENAGVEVIDWRSPPQTPEGTIIEGRIQNRGQLVAAGITVRVALRDQEGVEIAVANAELSAAALVPGARSRFVATFQRVAYFTSVEFSISATEVDSADAEGPVE